jgi:hypothetical protein
VTIVINFNFQCSDLTLLTLLILITLLSLHLLVSALFFTLNTFSPHCSLRPLSSLTHFTPLASLHRYQLALTFNSTQFRCLGPVTPLAIPHTASTNNATAGTLIVAGTAGQLSGSSAIVSPAHDGVSISHMHSLHCVECHSLALTSLSHVYLFTLRHTVLVVHSLSLLCA